MGKEGILGEAEYDIRRPMPGITAGASPTPRHGGWWRPMGAASHRPHARSLRPNTTKATGPNPVPTSFILITMMASLTFSCADKMDSSGILSKSMPVTCTTSMFWSPTVAQVQNAKASILGMTGNPICYQNSPGISCTVLGTSGLASVSLCGTDNKIYSL